MKSKGLLIGAAAIVPAILLGLVFSIVLLLGDSKPASAGCGPAVSGSINAGTKVDGYSAEQLSS